MSALSDLPNVGKALEANLIRAGITMPEQLRSIGAKEAFLRIRLRADDGACLNMLYGIEGAMCQRYCDKLQGGPDILELEDIIRLTGFSKSGVLKWLSSGKLLSFRIGRFYKIPKAGLLKFWLSPTYRNIKNKSAVQKQDLQVIDLLCAAMEQAKCIDD